MAKPPEVPDSNELVRDTILRSMLQNISDYHKREPSVKVDVLKESVLQKVIDAPDPTKPDVNFDPEVQLRGFLRAFAETAAFSTKIKLLDDVTQTQIRAFLDDREWKKTVEGGFRLPGYNPAVSQALTTSTSLTSCPTRVINSVMGCLAGVLRSIALLLLKCKMGFATEMLAKEDATEYAGGPNIAENEDKANQKTIEVSP